MEITRGLIQKLPKTDLHCHLDGSVRIETIIDLSKKYNLKYKKYSPKELSKLVVVGDDCDSLEEYLKAFEITLSVMQTKEGLRRIAYELAYDVSLENVKYLEVRFCPALHNNKGLKNEEVIDAVLEGLKQAEAERDIKCGLIISAIRQMAPVKTLQLAELAVEYKGKGVVGFDLAGGEIDYPAKEHREAFYLVLNNNINVTLHAGEAFGPESISQAIHYCGAHRIGHGTRLKDDEDLMNYVNDHRIPLEMCLTSNVQTKAVKDFISHPIKYYFDKGLRVTINTDNRLMSNTTLSNEIYLAMKYFNWTLEDLYNLIVNGFKSGFLPYDKKVKMLQSVIEKLRNLLYRDVLSVI